MTKKEFKFFLLKWNFMIVREYEYNKYMNHHYRTGTTFIFKII